MSRESPIEKRNTTALGYEAETLDYQLEAFETKSDFKVFVNKRKGRIVVHPGYAQTSEAFGKRFIQILSILMQLEQKVKRIDLIYDLRDPRPIPNEIEREIFSKISGGAMQFPTLRFWTINPHGIRTMYTVALNLMRHLGITRFEEGHQFKNLQEVDDYLDRCVMSTSTELYLEKNINKKLLRAIRDDQK
jgi:hypothetical protein